MKTYEEILAQVITLVEEASSKTTNIKPGTNILGDLGLDSLDYATIFLGCEKWLGIRIEEDGIDWTHISTVANLATFFFHEQQKCA